MTSETIFIDSDNAMGAPRGDVDDGFAIAALLRSGLVIEALASVAGNASEEWADRNNRSVASLCGFRGPVLRGAKGPGDRLSDASRAIANHPGPLRIAALGPLTNVAGALRADPAVSARITQLVIVGANSRSKGEWPPYWPHEFNLTEDREAAQVVFESGVPLTVVPLDVAFGLRAGTRELAQLTGPIGWHLREGSRRWIRRCRFVRLRSWFPVWDLVAAMYMIEPGLFGTNLAMTSMPSPGFLSFREGTRQVTVVDQFDHRLVWNRFLDLLSGPL